MKILTPLLLTASIASLLLSFSSTVNAQAQADLQQKMRQACLDKDEGDICDFENDKGESINGQCKRTGSADSSLYCTATN